MPQVHARWSGKQGATFCGERGVTVTIRTPDDWAFVNCPTCAYAASRNE